MPSLSPSCVRDECFVSNGSRLALALDDCGLFPQSSEQTKLKGTHPIWLPLNIDADVRSMVSMGDVR